MGRPIAMTHLDPQGDNARYQEFARRFLDKDQVDVLIGGETSASREAIRPIVDKHDVPYFYTNQYEGGVCDAREFSTGAIPEQQFSTLIPYMVKTFGPKSYVIAADYNFGQLSAEWNRSILKQPDPAPIWWRRWRNSFRPTAFCPRPAILNIARSNSKWRSRLRGHWSRRSI